MGVDDEAPTGLAPTQLGDVIETEANTAWSLDDTEDYPERWWTPARITALAVAASAIAIGAAVVVAVAHLNRPTLGAVSWVHPDTSPTIKVPPVGPSGFNTPPPTPPPNYDALFVSALKTQGWVVWDARAVGSEGRMVCEHLRDGYSPAWSIQDLTTSTTATRKEAEMFVSTAMRVYPNCP